MYLGLRRGMAGRLRIRWTLAAGRGARFCKVMLLAGALLSVQGGTAGAHPLDGVGMGSSCVATNINGRAQMVVSVNNASGQTLNNVAPGDLLAGNAGSASILFQTYPRPLRSLLPNKTATFKWKGLLFGDGFLDLSIEMLARLDDGSTVRSGIINCSRLEVGDTSQVFPPPTPTAAEPPPTEAGRPTATSPPGRTLRPTRTPIPTSTGRPTRTPVFTSTPRPTRTSISARITVTPSNPIEPTPTLAIIPTRTRIPTSTRRPTRTPIGQQQPTRTAVDEIDDGGLQARCILRRTVDLVQVTLLVANRTGVDLTSVAANDLILEPEGGALFFDNTGPSPRSYGSVTVGSPVTFQWSGRLSAGGTMGFRASAQAVAPGGRVLRSGLADCGVATADDDDFDPSAFSGTCSISPDDRNGRVEFTVRNGTSGDLTSVQPFLRDITNSGTAQIFALVGPGPRLARRLGGGQGANFVWRGRMRGSGDVTVKLEAMATRANGERVSTGPVECTASLSSPTGGLADLTVLESDLRDSILIETRDFSRDNCAVVEGCVAAPGRRRLLRFTTTTPNLGPGDVFFGDPANNPLMTIDACHGHAHFEGYAAARLLEPGGGVAASGHKASFCLIDLWPIPGVDGRRTPQFTDCGFQGISAGWADVYHRNLDCQWVDITGVAPGRYVLELEVNPDRDIPEWNYSNNAARVEVDIPAETGR